MPDQRWIKLVNLNPPDDHPEYPENIEQCSCGKSSPRSEWRGCFWCATKLGNMLWYVPWIILLLCLLSIPWLIER